MSEADMEKEETQEDAALNRFNPIHAVQQRINMLEAGAKVPPLRPTTYYNDPAVVEKLATLTIKVTELERLITFQATHPTPPLPAGPSRPPGLPRPPPPPPLTVSK